MIDFNNIDFTVEEALVQIQSVIYNCTDPQSIREKIKDILNRYIDQYERCNLNGVHKDGDLMRRLRAEGQEIAMKWYGMTKEEFIAEFGKSYIEED